MSTTKPSGIKVGSALPIEETDETNGRVDARNQLNDLTADAKALFDSNGTIFTV